GGGGGGGGGGEDGGTGGGGGGLPTLMMLAPAENPSALAINDTNVYWVDKNGDVRTVSKSGGSVTTISHSGGGSAGSPPRVIFMLADEVAVYWSFQNTYWHVPLSGGTPT